jgi:transcriptional regulator GlxA family with amidase domain
MSLMPGKRRWLGRRRKLFGGRVSGFLPCFNRDILGEIWLTFAMAKKLGLVLYENVQPMDVIGPWEVLAMWKKVLQAPIEMYLVSENGGLVNCDDDIVLQAHCAFGDCPGLDYLIVPGGRGRREEIDNDRLIGFIRAQAETAEKIISVCTGMFLLHKAGLLTNKPVTTYWRALAELRTLKDVDVQEERVVKSGNVWTSGGVSSGIDLAFELIAEIAGREVAGRVQLLFEYFPTRTIYCGLDTWKSLPSYYDNQEPVPSKYIADIIREATQRTVES